MALTARTASLGRPLARPRPAASAVVRLPGSQRPGLAWPAGVGATRGVRPTARCWNTSAPEVEEPVEVEEPEARVLEQPQTSPATEGFVWTKCWYPVTALDYLNPSTPHQTTILGRQLVVWRDETGTWRCFKDSCPHRAAPLSEGRIHPETKLLECAYHGWQFTGSGVAAEIPQSQPGPAKVNACANKRSCATAHPTAEAHGLLWVWLDAGPDAGLQAAATPLPTCPSTDHAGREWFPVSPWYVRDLEVDYIPLLENTCDPSHVHFTHAGFIGSPAQAGPITINLKDQGKSGVYRFECDDPKHATFRHLTLQPPCMLWAASEAMAPEGELALLYFVVPVAPGKSRLMSMPLATSSKFKGMAKIFHWQPWLRHLYNHKVAAQDIVLLHRQGVNMAAPTFGDWRRSLFLATSSDAGTVVLRKWLETVAGGDVAWPSGSTAPSVQPQDKREALLDHYHQHTEHCPHCLKGLSNVRIAASVMLGVAGACFLGLAYVWGHGGALLSRGTLLLAPGLVASLAARQALKGLEQQFIFSDWRHSERH